MANSESTDLRNAALTLRRLLPSGECAGIDERGREFCVRGAVPGDVVLPSGGAQRGQRRRTFTLLSGASERRESPCSVQAACGGCALMPLTIEAQREAKLSMLSTALSTTLEDVPAVRFVESPHALGYRNRVRLRIVAGKISFFNRMKENACAVLEPSLRALVLRLRELSEATPELFLPFTHCEVRSADSDGRPALSLGSAQTSLEARAQLTALQAHLPEFLLGVHADPEIARQRRSLTRDVYAFVPLDAFVQINDAVNALLLEWVLGVVEQSGARSALDLYAGAGNFGLPLARAGLDVTAVERHPASVRALSAAAHAQGLHCEGLALPAEAALTALSVAGRRFDCVIVDAPRAGAEFDLGRLAELGAQTVVLCSCYAPSFARDLGRLRRAGYSIAEIVAWDMFPQTHHLESLALLVRDPAQG